jgi:DNA-directed RNA polymerase specialized sigma subunit
MLDKLDAALLRLDAAEHAFVRAFYGEERSLAAIAADMTLSIRTISRLHKRVKETLAPLLGRAPAKVLP